MNPKHIKKHIVRKTDAQRPDFSDAVLNIENENAEAITVDREQRRLLIQAIQMNGILLNAEQLANGFATTTQEIEEDIDYLYKLQSTVRIRIGREAKNENAAS